MKKGKFIVIEGIDGSGKTTQIDMIKGIFERYNIPVHVTRECTDNPIGLLLRNLYLPGKRKCDERVINMLYAADRLDHITNEENGMLSMLNNGINVISDRYYLSSMAYDTYRYVDEKRNYLDALNDIINRNRVNMELLTPDVTIYIDTPYDVALQRIIAARESEEVTVYENSEKLRKIHRSYQYAIDYLINTRNESIKIIDGTQEPDVIFEHIKNIINSVLNIPKREE